MVKKCCHVRARPNPYIKNVFRVFVRMHSYVVYCCIKMLRHSNALFNLQLTLDRNSKGNTKDTWNGSEGTSGYGEVMTLPMIEGDDTPAKAKTGGGRGRRQ